MTAPGDRQHCKKPGCDRAPYCGHEQCDCTGPEGLDLALWNGEHGRRFNHFRTRLRRDNKGSELQYLRGCEPQDGKRRDDSLGRNALHDHLLIRSRVPLDYAAVKALAMACGFGHSVKLYPVVPGSKREAYYVSKYVVKSADSRRSVPWVDLRTGEVCEVARYRTWSMSREYGLSMVEVRAQANARRLEYLDGIAALSEAEQMSVLSAGFPGLEPVPDESPPLPS